MVKDPKTDPEIVVFCRTLQERYLHFGGSLFGDDPWPRHPVGQPQPKAVEDPPKKDTRWIFMCQYW